MRKLIWAAGIVLGVVLVAALGLSLYVRSYLKSDRLKALVVPRLEALTGRQVTVDDIDVSLFKGIVVKGISIKQRDGRGDFARTEQFILNYSLMPLLKRQLVIEKVEVVGPYVYIRRERDGSYNFSDIIKKRTAGAAAQQKAGAPEEAQELPVSIVTNRIALKDARLEFVDAQNALPQVSAHISDGRLTAAVGRILGDIDVTGAFDIKNITAVMGALKTATTGKVEIKNEGVILDLTTTLGKDTVKTHGTITGSLAAPVVRLDFSSRELDLEKLMALSGGQGRTGSRGGGAVALRGEGGRSSETGQRNPLIRLVKNSPEPAQRDLMQALTAAGTAKVETGRYGDYTIKDFSLQYRYEKGTMRIEPVSLRLTGGSQVAVEGSATAAALFRVAAAGGDIADAVKRTLSAKGTANFSSLAVRQSKITDAAARLTGIEELRNPRFDRARFDFSAGGQKIALTGTMDSPQIKVVPSGTIGFDKRIDMVADVRLSPELTARLGRGGTRIAGFLKDSEGWSTIPLKITGTTEKPSVSLNPVSVQRQLQQSLQSELQRRLQKELAPQQEQGAAPGQQAPSKSGRPEDILRDLFGR